MSWNEGKFRRARSYPHRKKSTTSTCCKAVLKISRFLFVLSLCSVVVKTREPMFVPDGPTADFDFQGKFKKQHRVRLNCMALWYVTQIIITREEKMNWRLLRFHWNSKPWIRDKFDFRANGWRMFFQLWRYKYQVNFCSDKLFNVPAQRSSVLFCRFSQIKQPKEQCLAWRWSA